MEVISITNQKGGVAKTCTSHAIGAGLSHRGYKTLFIDLDSQCNLTYDTGANTAPPTIWEVLTGTATAQEAIQHTEGGDVIAGSISLAEADTTLQDVERKEYRLRDALEAIAGSYDYCVIDCPPALGVLTVNALTASDKVIVPAIAETHSLQGTALLSKTIQTVQRYTNPALKVEGILITRYKGQTILAKDMRANFEAVASQLHTKVFSTPIRECNALSEAEAMQEDIYTYSPKSNGTEDYTALVEELLRG